MARARMHPKDRQVVRELFGSAASLVEQGVSVAQTPTGAKVVKAAKVAGGLVALAIVVGSIDTRSTSSP